MSAEIDKIVTELTVIVYKHPPETVVPITARDLRIMILEIESQRAALSKAGEALKALIQESSTIEVLGEWSAMDVNHTMSKKYRARTDAVIQQAQSLLADPLVVEAMRRKS
jgi:hypothetical protein